jgi:Tol biopolymer transport system component/DNA-binding winged helix-turn-helix (wHTH) protein
MPSHFYEFGPFSLDAPERTLRRGEEIVRLTPKEMEILLALVRGAGRIVPKEELLKEVWPDTYVEEATLAQNIFTLRKALGRADASQQYIETVPRRGYRFVPKVCERREEEGMDRRAAAAGVAAGESVTRPGRLEPDAAAAPDATTPATADGSTAGALSEGARTLTEMADEPPSAAGVSTSVERGLPSAEGLSTSAPPLPSHAPPGHPVRGAVLIALAAVLGVGGLVYAVYRFSLRQHLAPHRPAPFESMQLTRLPVAGAVADAAVSPDGNVLAYVTNEPGGQSIRVKQISTPSDSRQLVAPAEGTAYPGLAFSPDGQHVYFAAARQDAPFAALQRVPVFGGPVRTLLEEINSPVSFSPDGRRLAVIRGIEQARTLYVFDADGANPRELAHSPAPRVLTVPAWSPDGRTIACGYVVPVERESGRPAMGVTLFDAKTGAEAQTLPARWFELYQLAWMPDGSGLLLSAAERELSPPQVWLLTLPNGETRRVTNDLNSYQSLSITADAKTLVTVQTDRVPNLWVAPASDPSRARQLTTGPGRFDGYYGVAWTPDGRLLYSSVASGSWDIWVMNADGTGARQLTSDARSNYGPSVSPDGRHIVFVSNRAGGPFNVWRMDADGSNPKQLTSGRGENFPHVTPDGRWVVYATVGATDPPRVWKVPIDGGEPVALTREMSSWPDVSPDGKSFVCVYNPTPAGPLKLAVIPIEGGEPAKMFDVGPTFRMNTVWLPDNRGIAYADARDGTLNVWVQPLAGGKPFRLTSFARDGVTAYDISRDGKQLALTRTAETTGVVLIRDFK